MNLKGVTNRMAIRLTTSSGIATTCEVISFYSSHEDVVPRNQRVSSFIVEQEGAAGVVHGVVVDGEHDTGDQHGDNEDDESDEKGPAQLRSFLERTLSVPVEPSPDAFLVARLPGSAIVSCAVRVGGSGSGSRIGIRR